MDPLLIMLVVMLLAFWLMSRFARKQQQKMADQQAARIEEAMVPGTWVRTRAGFYGTVVEVDGDVVTLATPLGDESLWAKSSILGAEEPPFASTEAEAQPSQALAGEEDEASDAVATSDASGEQTEVPEQAEQPQDPEAGEPRA